MRPLPRILAGVVAVAVLSVSAAACDTSPVAATVNGQLIKETALDTELRQLSANHAYITEIDKNSSAKVGGVAPGTYSTAWTAYVLTNLVAAAVVHEYLARRHELPGPAMRTAALTVNVLQYESLWSGFSSSYQATLTERSAELATLEPPTAPASEISSVYGEYPDYFFSEVCVRTAAVSVTDAAGQTDYSASLAQADALVSAIDATSGGAAHSSRGIVTCYTPAELDDQSPGFAATVRHLATGRATKQKTGFGYEVLAVASRTALPLDDTLKRALSVAINSDEVDSTLEHVLARARVRVNPAYGTWGGSVAGGYEITAPKAPTT